MKETELSHTGGDTGEFSDMNCQMLEEVLHGAAYAISFPSILGPEGATETRLVLISAKYFIYLIRTHNNCLA